ncbi:MAG: ferritin family protein [Dehalococcoidia bacterium]
MGAEQDKTLQALEMAIQMENDGQKFYLKASEEIGNEMGKRLMQSLAAEEEVHRKKFQEVYKSIQNRRGWPSVDFEPDGGKKLRTILATATEDMGADAKPSGSEMDAVEEAMELENKTRAFYNKQAKVAAYDAERELYETLASEEQEHHLILLDYYEYLKDPADWFTTKEHHSLDGG